MFGYVRVAGGYLPLGELVQRGAGYRGRTLYRVTYQFETPIPFRVLDRVRAASSDQPFPGTAWLRHMPHDPVSAIRGFVTEWYADLAPLSGPLSTAVMPLPLLSALPLSCFLLATLLFEALLTSEYRMHGRVWREDKERAVAGLSRVPLAGREIHDDGVETYVGRGLVIQAQPWDEDTWSFSAAARHRADLVPVERFRNF